MTDILVLGLTFLVAIIASFIGTNVGGGGLISIPFLIFMGVPAQVSIASNKLGGFGMNAGGMLRFHGTDKLDKELSIKLALVGLVGAYVGARTLLVIPDQVLERLVAGFILVVLAFILVNRDLGVTGNIVSLQRRGVGYVSFFFIGFWAAFFGGGWAIFGTFALMHFFGQTFTQSAANRKLFGMTSSLVAILVYTTSGIINWAFGFTLFAGMAIGSYAGTSYGLRKGDRWIRGLFIVIVLASAIKLLI